MSKLPLLYSFRRCPYAMRARMALAYAGIDVATIEVDLRNKPQAMLDISPKGTVPVLQLQDGEILEESLDIIIWALKQNDPEGWMALSEEQHQLGMALAKEHDGTFKTHLNHYKYSERYNLSSNIEPRTQAMQFLDKLTDQLKQHQYLLSNKLTFADIAIFPFVRQFKGVDPEFFESHTDKCLQDWLNSLLDTPLFEKIMRVNKKTGSASSREHPYFTLDSSEEPISNIIRKLRKRQIW